MKLAILIQRGTYARIPATLTSLCLFLASIQYCWIAESTSIFDKVSKKSDPRIFLLCVALTAILTLKSWKSLAARSVQPKLMSAHNASSLLSREQSEEWKGWMQMVILFYHYFGLSNNLPIYQVIRVLVGAYIFLTGYGHTSYFLKSNDFSFDRTLKTLLRLNLLSSILAYITNRPWDFYYFPGLSSFWYLVMLVTLRLARISTGNLCLRRACISLLISCAIVQALLYSAAGEVILSFILLLIDKVGGPHIDCRELVFRLKLDSIVPYFGSLLAIFNTHASNEPLGWIERRLHLGRIHPYFVQVHALWLTLFIIVVYFLLVQQIKDKVTSNIWHPFTSVIPIMAMLGLRNATSQLRSGYNGAFRWLGIISLELYILQSHIWLTNNNKSLLHISVFDRISSDPRSIVSIGGCLFEKLIITSLFLLSSNITAHATKPLIDWLMGEPKKRLLILLICYWMLNLHWKKLF